MAKESKGQKMARQQTGEQKKGAGTCAECGGSQVWSQVRPHKGGSRRMVRACEAGHITEKEG